MNFLAINTAGRATQIVMKIKEKLVVKELDFSRHSENLFPLLCELLEENGVSLDSFDCFGGVVGPGSFTGIRIGLSVIKSFSFVNKSKVVAVNSLEVLAYGQMDKIERDRIVAVINAGAGMVYHQVFLKEGNILKNLTQPKLDKIKHFTGFLHSNYNDDVEIVYNHNNEKGESFVDLLGESVEFSAKGLERAVLSKILSKNFTNAIEITPLYLRVSQAEQILGELEFYRAKKEDVSSIVKLESQDDEWDLPWTKNCVLQSFDNPNFEAYILKNKKEPLGFVSVMKLVDEVEILRVVVLKQARLLGLGQKMIMQLKEIFRQNNFKSILLEVNSQNFPAFSLYQKLGFIKVGQRKDYYGSGQDAILMRLDI